ncbi:hypothetical protein E2C01_028083 [Portunus trituberculatus]|uniref:Uncharacterized protein n=1 Tax=Portunus trituberculatus TaxID=210409 RepID=A0A5B7EMP3_PORTR|nr:hypothetical protein [Portunus trituberculatus]
MSVCLVHDTGPSIRLRPGSDPSPPHMAHALHYSAQCGSTTCQGPQEAASITCPQSPSNKLG